MTYWTLKNITKGLLTGDNVLPNDDNIVKGLTNYALMTVATKADSLHLMTLDSSINILRAGRGDFYIRVPSTPSFDDEELDIDKELTFAVARFLASYISKDKGGIHVQAADRIILDFNSTVSALMESVSFDAIKAECDVEVAP